MYPAPVAPKTECGYYDPETQKRCKNPKLKDLEHCYEHPPDKQDEEPQQQRKIEQIDSIQDVIDSLAQLWMKVERDEVQDMQKARVLSDISKQLTTAIKERDANSIDRKTKHADEIKAIMLGAKNLSISQIMDALVSTDFGYIAESYITDVEVLEKDGEEDDDSNSNKEIIHKLQQGGALKDGSNYDGSQDKADSDGTGESESSAE